MQVIVILICFLLNWPTLVEAELIFDPRLDLRTEYNDNLFLGANRTEGDQITTLSPGLHIEFIVPHLTLNGDYSLLFRDYNKHSELDETRLSDAQRASLMADLFPGRDFTIRVVDTISRVSLDSRRSLVDENDFLNRSNLNHLLVNPSYTFRNVQHFEAALGYFFDRSDYAAVEGDDSKGHAASLDLSRDLSANLALLAGFRQRFHRADLTEDYDRQDYYGGVRFQISPKVLLQSRVGQTHIQPDNLPETKALFLSLGIDYEYSTLLLISGSISQDYSDSATEGLFSSRSASGTFAYKGRVHLDLSGRAEIGAYEHSNREDRSAGVGLVLEVPIGGRTSLRLGSDFTYYNFRPDDEVAYRYGGTVSLGYTYGVFVIRGSYAHRVNDSTFAFNDYRNNIVAGEIGLRF